ncbi:hypothetical protein WCX72_10015 [Sulfurimonas sp. HSL1-6]|uniref:hypothetical protein n=1 Tax=Thiomicrolovo immobilis TaxID=3131935 RepID=UPI0031F9501D
MNWFLGGLGLIIVATMSYAGTQATKVPALEQRIEDCKESHRAQSEINKELIALVRDTREELAGVKAQLSQLNKSLDRIDRRR